MSNLKFSDGVNIDTSGPYRTLHLHDGWYVVGKGMLAPVKDKKEAEEFILELEKNSVKETNHDEK